MQSWLIWPEQLLPSVLVLVALALPILYGARQPVHLLLRSLSGLVAQPLRLAARWLGRGAAELRERNRVVLLAQGRAEATAGIEREFQRVSRVVERDLQGYPALQRRLLDELTRIEEDYKKCGEVPPPPPEWVHAVEAIAKIKTGSDGLVEKILNDIADSVDSIYERVVGEYRRAYSERHRILKGFLPFWRSLDRNLGQVGRSVTALQDSAGRIDAQMQRYEEMLQASASAVHQLVSSALTQFAISGLVLLVALGGAFVNFWLIARPMSAMVGAGEYLVGGLETAHVAALVIILVEASMGLFLMESLRITHLFPRIHHLPDRMRERLIWASAIFLTILAGVEVALAVTRDQIIAADLVFKQGLGGAPAVAVELGWVGKIPVAGQMVLGFVLPFALAFVAVPLEYFMMGARTVLGAGLVGLLRLAGFMLRVSATALARGATFVAMFYDAVIFLPLLIERAVVGRSGARAISTTTGGSGS